MKPLNNIVELAEVFAIILVFIAIIYFLGRGEKKEKKREALMPFTSGETVEELRIQYKMKWIYYISLFSIFEAVSMFLLLSVKTLLSIEIGILFGVILLIAIWLAPSVEEVEI